MQIESATTLTKITFGDGTYAAVDRAYKRLVLHDPVRRGVQDAGTQATWPRFTWTHVAALLVMVT